MDTLKLLSPRINELMEQLRNGSSSAVCDFWTGIEKEGAPLIEEIEGDEKYSLITFLYRQQDEDIKNILIYGGIPGYRYSENVMERLMDTEIWFKTYKIRNDVKFKYNYSLNYEFDDDFKKIKKNTILDQLNRNKAVFIKNDEDPGDEDNIYSLVKMPHVKPDRWTVPNNVIQKGHIDISPFSSEILGNKRRIWVYTPYGYKKENPPYNMLVLTDGFDYLNYLSAPVVLNNLITEDEVPPLVCVLIDSSKSRYEHLTCSESFSRFITEELMPWVYENYNVTRKPEETIIGGVSLGGLAASYFAFKNPDIFGNVLSQSGSYWYESQWLTKQYENAEKLIIKFYLDCGVLEDHPYDTEPIMMEVINNMRDVLLSKGYDVTYGNFQSGHDYLCWGETLAEGLIALIGNNKTAAEA